MVFVETPRFFDERIQPSESNTPTSKMRNAIHVDTQKMMKKKTVVCSCDFVDIQLIQKCVRIKAPIHQSMITEKHSNGCSCVF